MCEILVEQKVADVAACDVHCLFRALAHHYYACAVSDVVLFCFFLALSKLDLSAITARLLSSTAASLVVSVRQRLAITNLHIVLLQSAKSIQNAISKTRQVVMYQQYMSISMQIAKGCAHKPPRKNSNLKANWICNIKRC